MVLLFLLTCLGGADRFVSGPRVTRLGPYMGMTRQPSDVPMGPVLMYPGAVRGAEHGVDPWDQHAPS